MTGALASTAIPSGVASKNKLCALFPNRVKAILRPPGSKSWVTISKHWPLPNETILAAVAGTERDVYGLRWGDQTRFAVLDVDAGGKYHDAQALKNLLEILAGVSLTATVYQSSDSGGWHVYLFLSQWENCNEVQETLRAWLTANGYEIRGGQLEIFPSGNGLRLPLQSGFAWLDHTGAVLDRRENLTTNDAISRFLKDLEARANNWTESRTRIRSQLEPLDRQRPGNAQGREERLDTADFERLFNYRLIPEKYEDGRRYWQTGLTAKGQRHDAILAVEHYLWHGDQSAGVPALPGDWNDEPRYRRISAWIEAKHNGFCNHINKAKWAKVEAQIRRAVKWRRLSGAVQVRTPYQLTETSIERLIALSKSTGRTWTTDDLKKGNEGREATAREKIRQALQLLTNQGRRVTGRELMRLTGCSYHTVRRHSDIWKISPVVSLPRAAGDKNPFVDLLAPCVPAPVASGSGLGSEKSFLPSVVQSDSGDLDVTEGSGSVELAPIVLLPPFLLPGFEPTSEPPASSPSPAGAFGSLDAGALVRRYSGRTADGAGGSGQEPSCISSRRTTAVILAWSRQRHAAKPERSGAATGRRKSRAFGEECLHRSVRQDKERTARRSRSPPGLIYWHCTNG